MAVGTVERRVWRVRRFWRTDSRGGGRGVGSRRGGVVVSARERGGRGGVVRVDSSGSSSVSESTVSTGSLTGSRVSLNGRDSDWWCDGGLTGTQ